MDEIVTLVSERTGLPRAQAQSAVETVIGVLKERLPAPIAGQIDNVINGGGSAGDLLKGVGGLFGG